MQTVGKIASSSHLALRFYKKAGWTREELEASLLEGSISDSEVKFGDPSRHAYFTKEPSGKWDFGKLLPLIKEIIRYPGADPRTLQLTDEAYAKLIDG